MAPATKRSTKKANKRSSVKKAPVEKTGNVQEMKQMEGAGMNSTMKILLFALAAIALVGLVAFLVWWFTKPAGTDIPGGGGTGSATPSA
jgi:nitrate reductase NapE component